MPAITRPRKPGAIPAPVLFVLSGISMYLGAAVAVRLFEVATPAGVAWLRCLGAAIVLLLWRRPGRTAWRGRRFLLAGAFGLVTAGMNIVFYAAIARLPLGTAVALEFVGPVVVAALGSRSRRDVAALLLVTAGVVCIADVKFSGSPLGVVFALGAAAAWAGYILLGNRVAGIGGVGSGIDSLAVGFTVATVLLSPLAWGTGRVWADPKLALLGVGVGVLSTVVPYALDQIVFRRISRAVFAVLLALLPVTATVIGFLALGQIPMLLEAVGIVAVVVGVALRARQEDNRTDPDTGEPP